MSSTVPNTLTNEKVYSTLSMDLEAQSQLNRSRSRFIDVGCLCAMISFMSVVSFNGFMEFKYGTPFLTPIQVIILVKCVLIASVIQELQDLHADIADEKPELCLPKLYVTYGTWFLLLQDLVVAATQVLIYHMTGELQLPGLLAMLTCSGLHEVLMRRVKKAYRG